MQYVIEFKKKSPDGFVHSKKTVLSEAGIDIVVNDALSNNAEGLEFLTVRVVKAKAEPKKVEVKK